MVKVRRVTVVAALAASLVLTAAKCKNDCQGSVQSNGPGNMVNSKCDK